jgi:Derlin-2/3
MAAMAPRLALLVALVALALGLADADVVTRGPHTAVVGRRHAVAVAPAGPLLALRGGAADEDEGEEDEDDDDVELDEPKTAPSSGAPQLSSGSGGNPLLRAVKAALLPPLKVFVQAPPITRSWVSASLGLALLTNLGVLDARAICMSEPLVMHGGEWWRLLTNFFFMGDALKSIFFWVQLHHFWDCCKMLEMVKYRWEPSDFIKLIVCNAAMLCFLKSLFPHTIFLGSPMVMVFLYMYAREYEAQQMNLLGFFSIRCGWLPFAQMLQDLLQAGDISPNILGLLSGHTYFYFAEVRGRMLLPDAPSLGELGDLLLRGKSIITIPEDEKDEAADTEKDGDADEEDAEEEGEEEAKSEAAAAGSSGSPDEDDDAAPATAA